MPLPEPANAPPLGGIRIVECARGIPGPFAARVLAELGADVVKVELPAGDPARRRQPVGFATWNRGKRSVVLDPEVAEQRAELDDLLARADVFVHDLPAPRAAALGLGTEALVSRHPHLIVATVPAYPADHPRADAEASDSLVQAAEGLMDEQMGNREGPVYIRLPFPSWCAGLLLVAGISARLVQRERTGVVAPIATSLLQGAITPAALFWQRPEHLPEPPLGGFSPIGDMRRGHTLPKIWPDAALSIFECSDGRSVQLAGAVGGWIESAPVLEALAIADQVDLSEVGVTPDNHATWNAVFHTRTADEWVEILRAHDVPCVICAELGDVFSSEQAAANDYVVTVEDPAQGRLLQAAAPIQIAGFAATTDVPAPTLGTSEAAAIVAEWGGPRSAPEATGDPDLAPLAGMRALDFGVAVAGPFGAQCLADLGADVIKVEPTPGDRSRGLTQFAGSQRGKRALAIDLKDPAAREALERLVRGADVVLHNMRLEPAARLGIDGPGLRALNPEIAFSHISAYGTEGPLAGDPGYDPTAQAMTGWETANAGEGMPPIWLRNSVFDVQAGVAASAGACLALLHRLRNGADAEARTSLLAVGIAASSEVAIDRAGNPTPAPVLSSDQTGVSPFERIYQLRDGWVAVSASESEEERRVVGVLGYGGLDELSVDDALLALAAVGVPACRVELDQMNAFFDSPDNQRLGLARTLETTGYGSIDVPAGFWSGGWAERPQSIPDFAEHSVEVLGELGFADAEVEALLARGVVVKRAPVEDLHA
ncbi:MAG: CoA transferase [Solirubrobacterales bacterium]